MLPPSFAYTISDVLEQNQISTQKITELAAAGLIHAADARYLLELFAHVRVGLSNIALRDTSYQPCDDCGETHMGQCRRAPGDMAL